MDADRWKRVDELLDGALDRPPRERAKWLGEACAGDEELRSEVAKLLELAEREDDRLRPDALLSGSIGFEVARELHDAAEGPRVEVGDRLGAYRLVELLGKGGMGRVYAAQDAKLGRRIALKVLPPEMASEERRERFEREAKAVAALNHPNIVHLYSIEEEDGVAFLTMELVEGATLGERLPEGGLPLKKFFEIAVPLADALAAAHERGVVHRDLKPGNVMLGDDGRVKILDFGLAKLASELGNPSATQEGHILGTVSHMSPEQAEGKSVDHRTDVFSLGVILYEMATGRLPFTGDTPAALLSAILKESPPPVTDLNPKLPKDLARVVKRCLVKDPSRRYQTAADVRNELEELEYELGSRNLFRPVLERRGGLGLAVGSLAVAAALGVAIYLTIASRSSRTVDLLAGRFQQLTNEPGAELFPSLSPDGGFLAYASRVSGSWDVYLLRAGGERPINLTEGSGADDVQPAFSPDGQQIAFRSSRQDGGLYVMGATGESAKLFDGDAVQPSWSPNGHPIAYWGLVEGSAQRDLFTIPATGGTPVALTRDAAVDWNPVWSPDGRYLYFSSDRGGSMNLWRIPVDESSGEARGDPEPVRAPATFATHASFSRDGTRMVYASSLTSQTLSTAAFDPVTAKVVEVRKLARAFNAASSPRVSPDGEWIAFTRESPQEDIVLVRLDGGEARLVTDDPHRDRYPRWSPDGRRIAFYSNRGGSYEIWSVNPDGSDLARLTDLPEHPTRYPIFSPSGERLLFSTRGVTGIVIDPRLPWSEQTPELLPSYPPEKGEFVPLDWSPDGRRIAGYLQSASGVRSGIGVLALATEEFETLTDFGFAPFWLPDSRRILFQALGPDRSSDPSHYERDFKLFVVDRVTKEVEEALSPPGASAEDPVLSPDGRTLVFVETSFESDIWMLRALDRGETERGTGF